MPHLEGIDKVLILGSGAIKIGEAGEFDYSGSQAIKAMKEEGVKVVLVNPNIATIQTDPRFADKIHFIPVTPEYVEKVIEEERPDGVLLSFGGQTALNCGVELAERGVFKEFCVSVLGTGIRAIELADDRDLFRELMLSHDIPIPRSGRARSVEEALVVAEKVGYPIMVRVSYTLGGGGSGVAQNPGELWRIASKALNQSRIGQVLIERYIGKWKEVEYEVLRDAGDNCAVVCNMENFDPMGVHTGDSIVVAPSQTLNNREYHMLRSASFRVVRALGIVGECNVQFALDPGSEEFRVIEVNSRLSRSSALASKATGYPIAYIAAKVSLGYTLPELMNKVTGMTSAFFEPSLDYVVVKMPRWDFDKFRGVDRRIGTQMKSVGEVMAIGRNFKEALQKAVRMVDVGRELISPGSGAGPEELRDALANPTDKRVFQVAESLARGLNIEEIHNLTGIDLWFLRNIKQMVDFKASLVKGRPNRDALLQAKRWGFSDKALGEIWGREELDVRDLRDLWDVKPVVKQIDTLAAEWPSQTNYLYMTYDGVEDDINFTPLRSVMVLGSGCYHIGSSVEFDWCCVNMAWSLKDEGVEEVVMVNCNPETVSTDFDVLDKLYFEELTLERILDIYEKENPLGVVTSVGGQITNNLALDLHQNGVSLMGTTAENINRAEDRSKFSALLDAMVIAQPKWSGLETVSEAKVFARQIGYPVLIRPSYVLSGTAMNVAQDEKELERYLLYAASVSREHPVVVSKFMAGAREVEVDGVCDGSNVFIGAIIEHVEDAGVHSGDATMAIPTLTIGNDIKEKIRRTTRRIARSLEIRGPFNIQYLVRDGEIHVIETNLRASRSMPFVSKVTDRNLMTVSSKAILNKGIEDGEAEPQRYGVKSPQFSFMRLEGADPLTGVEMVSTGEVAGFGDSFEEALLKALVASGINLPGRGDHALISVGGEKRKAVEIARKLKAGDLKIYATEHTAEALRRSGVECENVYKISEGDSPNVLELLEQQKIKLVINTPSPVNSNSQAVSDGFLIRRKSVEFGVSMITNLELANTLAEVLEHHQNALS
jgi:carbamoyl-phosphate synthase large subunit